MSDVCPLCGSDQQHKTAQRVIFDCGSTQMIDGQFFVLSKCKDRQITRLTSERDEARQENAKLRELVADKENFLQAYRMAADYDKAQIKRLRIAIEELEAK